MSAEWQVLWLALKDYVPGISKASTAVVYLVSTSLNDVQKASQQQFGRQSTRYGKSHILADVSDVEAALERVSLPERARVLDIATGAGHTGLCLAARGYDVTCSDLTAEMLERVREAAAVRGLSVETRQHSAEVLPYTDSSFDLVTCRVAAHHFSDVTAFVRESARVLAPGGWFLVIDGSVQDGAPEAEAWTHQLEKLRDPSHGRFVKPNEWKALCVRAGLEVTECFLDPFKMPDLKWYFETAATPEANRKAVLDLVANAPDEVRQIFRLGEEDGKIVWWWQRITLVARKPD